MKTLRAVLIGEVLTILSTFGAVEPQSSSGLGALTVSNIAAEIRVQDRATKNAVMNAYAKLR